MATLGMPILTEPSSACSGFFVHHWLYFIYMHSNRWYVCALSIYAIEQSNIIKSFCKCDAEQKHHFGFYHCQYYFLFLLCFAVLTVAYIVTEMWHKLNSIQTEIMDIIFLCFSRTVAVINLLRRELSSRELSFAHLCLRVLDTRSQWSNVAEEKKTNLS